MGRVGTGYCVDPTALRLSGRRTEAIAEMLDASTPVAGGATLQVIAVHRGWQAAAGLSSCAQAWGARLTGAREHLEQISAKLESNALAYEQAEQEAVAKIKQVVGELSD